MINIIFYIVLLISNIALADISTISDDKELLLIHGALKNNLSSKVEKIDLEYDYTVPATTNLQPSFARITKITPKFGLFRGKVYYIDNSYREISGQYRAFTQVPIINRHIKIGEILTAADLTLDDIDITKSDQNILSQISQIIGHQVKRNLAPGSTIRVIDIIRPEIIQAGEPLTILYKSADMEIKATGYATKNASIGELIKVKNERSNKIVAARVISKGVVQVDSLN